MKNPLKRKTPTILDGGFATELERTFKKDLSGELWAARMIIEDPDAVKAVHRAYYDAGADIATTSTYQASYPGFAHAGYTPSETTHYFTKSVALAVSARDEYYTSYITSHTIASESHPDIHTPLPKEKPLVAASLGCYGALLSNGAEYTGDYGTVTEAEVYKFHVDRIHACLGEPGVDVLAFETVPKVSEARVIGDLMRREGFGVPAWVSFSCRDSRNVSHGESLYDAFEAVKDVSGIVGLGVNCTPPEYLKGLLESVGEFKDTHSVVVYPNSGEVWDGLHKVWKSNGQAATAESFAAMAKEEWVTSGATVIGGCCRTTPDYTKELKRVL
ncbi:hypothetical protein SmJEL517_g05297 [Synchytrium microbalum]|uniref:Hcy-binding domain-containing protein n=1 Tax=Synchytrium microbalum TaxID=1806994 RepID=A0A507BWX1_9FUNG|nr:uncharacterized protein SmJEL517_g05297 [Synchytrium microbalum]TPX31369.1 hypothetical protein SmJEL517_g05297 [Synchytrium microbalum]